MSQANVEVVKRGFDAFNRRDQEAFLALFVPDVEFRSYLDAVDPQLGEQGLVGMRGWWDGVLSTFPNFEYELGELRDLGDRVLVEVRMTGRGSQSGVPIELTLWVMFTLDAGLITRWATFRTKEQAVEAVGL
jgi:ketosteroid isomerase-like protein